MPGRLLWDGENLRDTKRDAQLVPVNRFDHSILKNVYKTELDLLNQTGRKGALLVVLKVILQPNIYASSLAASQLAKS